MEFHLNLASPQDDSVDSGASNSSVDEDGVFVTRELFPQSKGMGFGQDSSSSSSSAAADLGLRSCDFGGNQQKQVKRSRRGPRSRSSQYRGVTFYRRTGRWESHIWLAKKTKVCPFLLF